MIRLLNFIMAIVCGYFAVSDGFKGDYFMCGIDTFVMLGNAFFFIFPENPFVGDE